MGVLATCVSVCHVGAWCHRRPEEGTALAVWLWVVVNQHGREGWNHSSGVESTSVCIAGKLLFTFHQNRKRREEEVATQLPFSFFCLCFQQDPICGMVPPTLMVCCLSSISHLWKHPLMHTPIRTMPSVLLNLIKLTINISHHT